MRLNAIFLPTDHCTLTCPDPVGPLPTLALSPLPATLVNLPASVANKRLTSWLSPLDAILTKNRGVPPATLGRSDLRTFRRVSTGPIAAKSLWCNNLQRREISSRSGETTPLPSVSKITRADIGDCSSLVPFASRAWVQRSKAGFRVCTCKP